VVNKSAEVLEVNRSIRLQFAAGARRSALAAGVTLALAACATAPTVHVDTADDPMTCSSFAWLEPERPASIAEQRVRAEVMRTLQQKGYAQDEQSPDCYVSGVIFTGARPGSPVSVGVGAGRWGGSVGGSVGVSVPVGGRTRTHGNLAIDVIDIARNAEVWRGTLEAAFRTPEPTSEEVGGAVRQVLEAFPDRTN
jgi:hypothetical protein